MKVWADPEEVPWYNLHVDDPEGEQYAWTPVIDVPAETVGRWQRAQAEALAVHAEIEAAFVAARASESRLSDERSVYMTPAEELREAAKLMRERAQAADSEAWPGQPWAVTECSLLGSHGARHGCPCIVYQGAYAPIDQAQVPPITYVADAETEEHAAHIAGMHPGVALAIAGWLESLDGIDVSECGPMSDEITWALKIARAYLGVDKSVQIRR